MITSSPGREALARMEYFSEGMRHAYLNMLEEKIRNKEKVVVKRDGKIMEVSPRKLKKELLENYPELAAKLKPR
ncbi:MAG: hypothetical protein HUU43_15095 [Ignavibacteriaceae bacterium]|nr:hypothetical protein [Ignavibacteriaceae bacterium]NUM72169.1 hypothetical protein [Ignavibacteriaceae bacterium]